jgi:HPt (histidine-containing phosphotransfer) domain-containing protein
LTYNSETGRDERIIIHVDADLKTLLPGFLKDWQEEVRTMRDALEKNNYEAIRKIGHDMKGIGGSCGLDEITDMGSSLAESAKAMDQELIHQNLDTLSGYLECVEIVYE